jgi:hypothetical protein
MLLFLVLQSERASENEVGLHAAMAGLRWLSRASSTTSTPRTRSCSGQPSAIRGRVIVRPSTRACLPTAQAIAEAKPTFALAMGSRLSRTD